MSEGQLTPVETPSEGNEDTICNRQFATGNKELPVRKIGVIADERSVVTKTIPGTTKDEWVYTLLVNKISCKT